MTSDNERKKRAKEALNKPARYGSDLDLEEFEYPESDIAELESLDEISSTEKQLLESVGIDPEQNRAAGAFIQLDNEAFLADVMIKQEGLEIMPLSQARQKYDWVENYLWNAVPVDTDKFTARSELEVYEGYFIRALPGVKITAPVQSCLLLKKSKSVQNVHNLIIAEEGSEMHIITGCAAPSSVERSLHLGISEFYIKRNAKLSFTMVHNWSEKTLIRPRSAAIVDENGIFVSNYVILSPLRSIQTFPRVRLVGLYAKTELNSVVNGVGESEYDIGGAVSLEARRATGKVVSRSIATDKAHIIARGDLVGLNEDTKARLECDGLLLSSQASIRAIPMLDARVEGAELSHEATVGKVGAEQLNYLMSRGLGKEEATSLIVSGFMKLEVPDLPPILQRSIEEAIELSLKGGM